MYRFIIKNKIKKFTCIQIYAIPKLMFYTEWILLIGIVHEGFFYT